MADKRGFAFVFVCQYGELEVKALLLAASLRRFLKLPHELVAAVPTPAPLWGEPAPATLAALGELGVRVVEIENYLELGRDFTHSNKFACLNIETDADTLVFLDSDILCTRELHPGDLPPGELVVKPADLQTCAGRRGGRRFWRRAYRAAGLEVPLARIAATVSTEFGPPLFNSGVMAVSTGSGLGDAWRDAAIALRSDRFVLRRAPRSDMPSLAVAIHALGLTYTCVDERFNYPAHLRRLTSEPVPWFCHYHHPDVIQREPVLRALTDELLDELPALRSLIESYPDWDVRRSGQSVSSGAVRARA